MKSLKIVWVIIFVIGLGVRGSELFHPVDTSEWRESDMASIARNYYRNGMDFLHPQVDWGGKGPGYTESEFPVYSYLIALSYKLTGIWEPAGRVISYLFSMGTMLMFFRLSKYLFDEATAIVSSSFFAISPLLMITSCSIQPESMMFFFYICAVYTFIRWIDDQAGKYYLLTIIFTALALLCKITAINVGILFVLIIITKKGWRFLVTPKVLVMGALCIVPSIFWSTYSHNFYLRYGNSLGLSNQYAWIGPDVFTNPHFITGMIKQEVINIWTYSGPLIILIAIVSTIILRRQSIIIPVYWLASAVIFYFIAIRSTSSPSSFYYHIFSVPSVSMLLGISVIEIYNKYVPFIKSHNNRQGNKTDSVKSRFVLSVLFALVLFYLGSGSLYLFRNVPGFFKIPGFYTCKKSLTESIPEGSLILASGGMCNQGKYPAAYNASYFFYWLDRKGYNICIDAQSIENVLDFKEKGAAYFIAENQYMEKKKGFEELMRRNFKVLLECNGVTLFKL